MRLDERATELREFMDDPACDPDHLRRTLRRFRLVNPLVSCWGRVYRSHVRPVLADLNRPARILDIGCGAGDVLRWLIARARRDDFEVTGLGIDPDPRAVAVAALARPVPRLAYRQADSRELVSEGAQFDVVISKHLLHHLDEAQLARVLGDSAALARVRSLHSDIARDRAAYLAFSVAIAPLTPGSFLRTDGLRSIRRSYTPAELARQLPAPWRVEQPGVFRLLAVL